MAKPKRVTEAQREAASGRQQDRPEDTPFLVAAESTTQNGWTPQRLREVGIYDGEFPGLV